MTKVTLLSEKDLRGKLFKKIGKKCEGTRYANTYSYWTSKPSIFNYWDYALGFYVASAGRLIRDYVDSGHGVRPVLVSDNFDEIVKEQKPDKNGIYYVTHGEYPQNKADIQEELQCALEAGKLNETGKVYTIPELMLLNKKEFKLLEYEYNGKKYVCKENEWIEVTPIRWIVDEENRRLISEKSLLKAPLEDNNRSYNGKFETSSLYDYLNNQFINEIIPSNPSIQTVEEVDSRDEEIARLEKEIAFKQDLIRKYKENEIAALTAQNQALDAEISSLGIDANKGRAYTFKPNYQNSSTTSNVK